MFNVAKEVPSLELCKRLKELGYPQNGGLYYWSLHKPQNHTVSIWSSDAGGYIYPYIPKKVKPRLIDRDEYLHQREVYKNRYLFSNDLRGAMIEVSVMTKHIDKIIDYIAPTIPQMVKKITNKHLSHYTNKNFTFFSDPNNIA